MALSWKEWRGSDAKELIAVEGVAMLRLRAATADDWAKLWGWRNDPETAAQSRDQKPFTLKEHLAWLKRTLADDDIKLFIAEDSERGVACGTARLDRAKRGKEHWAEVSVTVAPRARSQGYGTQLVAAVCNTLNGTDWVVGLTAQAKPTNYASLRAFAACGFAPVKVAEDLVTLERTL